MGNWYCNNCKSWEDSWGDYPHYKTSAYTFPRAMKCLKCDRSSLIYTDSQKSRYKGLANQRTSIPGTVQEVERFGTTWSNNIATAISYYGGYYWVFLLVYVEADDQVKVFPTPTDYSCSRWGSEMERKKHNCLSDARREAKQLSIELGSVVTENPILFVHPNSDYYKSFDEFVKDPYVSEKDFYTSYFPSSTKPLDIIWSKESRGRMDFWHVGIYIGDGEVCHYSRSGGERVKIDGWTGFTGGGTHSIKVWHAIIPFKKYWDIVKNISAAINNSYWYKDYNLFNRNCEHFAKSVY